MAVNGGSRVKSFQPCFEMVICRSIAAQAAAFLSVLIQSALACLMLLYCDCHMWMFKFCLIFSGLRKLRQGPRFRCLQRVFFVPTQSAEVDSCPMADNEGFHGSFIHHAAACDKKHWCPERVTRNQEHLQCSMSTLLRQSFGSFTCSTVLWQFDLIGTL
jgi:hypothetical protein